METIDKITAENAKSVKIRCTATVTVACHSSIHDKLYESFVNNEVLCDILKDFNCSGEFRIMAVSEYKDGIDTFADFEFVNV